MQHRSAMLASTSWGALMLACDKDLPQLWRATMIAGRMLGVLKFKPA